MRRLIADVRLSCRTLGRSPGLVLVAVLLLTLAIGANTAVFTVARATLFQRLPVADPGSLLLFGEARSWGVLMGQVGEQETLSHPLLLHLRATDADFASLAGFSSFPLEVAARIGAADPAPAQVELVSGSYFSTLGVEPALGRLLAAGDDDPAAPATVVLNYGYWRRALGGSPAVVGTSLSLNGRPFTVVGVAPEGFFGETVGSRPPEIWAPLARQPEVSGRRSILDAPRLSWLYAVGRLRPGVTVASAQERLDGELRAWLRSIQGQLSPEERAGIGRATFRLTPISNGIFHGRDAFARAFRLLLGVSAVLLLLGCGNVAILLLARAVRRERDTDVRRALGAGRVDLLRHVIAEAAVLSAGGAVLGLALATPFARLLARWSSAVITPAAGSLDLPVLGFAAGAAAIATVLVSSGPAVRLWSRSVAGRPTSLAGTSARSIQRAPRAFIVLEVALALPLLLVGGLMARSLARLLAVETGFAHEGVVVAKMTLKPAHPRPEDLPVLHQALRARLAAVPGVSSAGLALYGPLAGESWVGPIEIEGATRQAPAEGVWWDRVTPGYLEALGAKVVAGRLLTESDAGTGAVVVNGEMVRRFFADGNPIGRRFSPAGDPGRRLEIVGVLSESRFGSPKNGSDAMYFAPFDALPAGGDESQTAGEIALRYGGVAAPTTAELRRALRDVNPDILLRDVSTLAERVDASTARERATAALCEIGAGLAFLLAIFGIGAVVMQSAAQRTREFGLRLALGAAPRSLLALVLADTLRIVATGVVTGSVLGLGAARLLRSELFGVSGLDVLPLAGAAALLLAGGLLAAVLPARRASRLEPVEALRQE